MDTAMSREANLLHQTHHPFASNLNTLIAQSRMNTRAAIDASMLLKNRHNLLRQLAIFPLPGTHWALSPRVEPSS
jgi:hypothetical protein